MSSPPARDRARRRPPQQRTPPATPQPPSSNTITVTRIGATVTISLHGHLDVSTGEDLIETAQDALAADARRIDIDLRGVASYTSEGARALGACRDLGNDLHGGLHYRTDQGPGKEALLEGYETPDDPLGEVVAGGLDDGND